MIHLYDGNNVMRRAMDKPALGGAVPMSLRQRYEATCAAPVGSQIWCWDGYNHNERRRKVYPLYKANREPAAEDIFAQIKLWREILTHSTATQIEVKAWEADDVIATLSRQLSKQGLHHVIHSNDMDYAQLDASPFVKLDGVNTKGVPARWVALYKAMVGDSSDNIKGIKGFGHKAWERMEPQWPQIERAIINGTAAGLIGLPFKPAVLAWVSEQENVDLLQAMLLVTHFENVPDDELEAGITPGTMNRAAAHARLKEFFL